MEVHLTQDQLEQLNKLASSTGRGADELVREAIDNLLAYNEWFRKEVEIGLAESPAARFLSEAVSGQTGPYGAYSI